MAALLPAGASALQFPDWLADAEQIAVDTANVVYLLRSDASLWRHDAGGDTQLADLSAQGTLLSLVPGSANKLLFTVANDTEVREADGTTGSVQTVLTVPATGEAYLLASSAWGTVALDRDGKLYLAGDPPGRITAKDETVGATSTRTEYAYDPAGRLSTVTQNGSLARSYGYDANGNRSELNGSPIATYDDQDRLLTYAGTTYSYTAHGTLTQKTEGSQITQYAYDAFGNLRSVTLPDSTQIDYLVDGKNRRVGKKVNGVLTQAWLYQDQLKIAAEFDGSGALVSRFVYGTKVNVPEYMQKGGKTYRLITDHLGSVRMVVDASSGDLAQRIDYDEFGKVLSDTNPGFQPFGFAGGLYDPQTRLVRFGARDYDAQTGRWTAKDPIGFGGGDSNQYSYALSNPVSKLDPSGLDTGAGFGLAARYLCEAGGDPIEAHRRALEDRIRRDWEALTAQGHDLRIAENYLAAYRSIIEGKNQWHGQTGAYVANAYMTPAWQLLRLLENLLGNELHSPADLDALLAGYHGAYDAYGAADPKCGCK